MFKDFQTCPFLFQHKWHKTWEMDYSDCSAAPRLKHISDLLQVVLTMQLEALQTSTSPVKPEAYSSESLDFCHQPALTLRL